MEGKQRREKKIGKGRGKERGERRGADILKDVSLVTYFLQISHLLELPELSRIALSAKKSSFQC